jgi:putative membrane protein
MGIFSPAESEEIARRVHEVEQRTASELVVVVAERSGSYELPRAILALVMGVGVSAELASVWPSLDGSWLPWVVAAGAVTSYLLLGAGPIVRFIVPNRLLEQKVHSRALEAFVLQGVTETRDRSGVLIFLSELEHQIVILADVGIHKRVDTGIWEREVQTLIGGIRNGQAGQTTLDVIERLGALLAEKFPADGVNSNELSDEVRQV